MAETLRAVDPLEFYRRHLQGSTRPDGRGLLKCRKLHASHGPISSADGSSLVRLGNTAVMVGIQYEPVAPSPDEAEASRGRIVVGVELPAVCSPSASGAGGGNSGAAHRLERDKAVLVELLQRTAHDGLVDLDSLCAVEGHAVWSCYCDIVVLEDDGNLTDVALLGLMCALVQVRLPRVTLDEASGELRVAEEAAVPIALAAPLYPFTFGLLDGTLLLDPNAEETLLLSTTVTVLLDPTGELRTFHKPGGGPLPNDSLAACVQAAQQRLPALAAVVSGAASHIPGPLS